MYKSVTDAIKIVRVRTLGHGILFSFLILPTIKYEGK